MLALTNGRWLPPVALVLLLGGAAWLRWQYITAISLYVDEFTTLWAARQVLDLLEVLYEDVTDEAEAECNDARTHQDESAMPAGTLAH